MTAKQEPHHPTVELVIGKFVDWLKHRRELSEIRRMNRTDFDMIAQDLRVSPDDLDRMVEAGPHSADEMPKMLEALGIDLNDLVRTKPLLVRDRGQGGGVPGAATAAEHYKEYCPNAPTIEALGESVKH